MNEMQAILSSQTCPLHHLDAYIYRVNQFPMLTEQTERSLTTLFFETGNLEAAKKLVLSHLRFVVHVARGYLGYGLGFGDLIQEGNIGLMKAVKRFRPSFGVRLSTFAIHWIKAEIHDFILKNWRIVKIATTKAQRKLFFNFKRLKNKWTWLNQDEIQYIASELKVKPEDVVQMEERLNAHDLTLENTTDGNDMDSKENFSPIQYLADHRYDPALTLESEDLEEKHLADFKEAFLQLEPRLQMVLKERWLRSDKKKTLQQLAKEMGISAERVRQLETLAMQQIKQYLTQKHSTCV